MKKKNALNDGKSSSQQIDNMLKTYTTTYRQILPKQNSFYSDIRTHAPLDKDIIIEIIEQFEQTMQLLVQNIQLANNPNTKINAYNLYFDIIKQKDQLVQHLKQPSFNIYQADFKFANMNFFSLQPYLNNQNSKNEHKMDQAQREPSISFSFSPQFFIEQSPLTELRGLISEALKKDQNKEKAINFLRELCPLIRKNWLPVSEVSQNSSTRTKFSPLEDTLLLLGLDKFGSKNLEEIREIFLSNKTSREIKNRYKNMIRRKAPDNIIKNWRALQYAPLTSLEEYNLVKGRFWFRQEDWILISKYFLPNRNPEYLQIFCLLDEKMLSKRIKCEYLFEKKNIDNIALDMNYDMYCDKKKLAGKRDDPKEDLIMKSIKRLKMGDSFERQDPTQMMNEMVNFEDLVKDGYKIHKIDLSNIPNGQLPKIDMSSMNNTANLNSLMGQNMFMNTNSAQNLQNFKTSNIFSQLSNGLIHQNNNVVMNDENLNSQINGNTKNEQSNSIFSFLNWVNNKENTQNYSYKYDGEVNNNSNYYSNNAIFDKSNFQYAYGNNSISNHNSNVDNINNYNCFNLTNDFKADNSMTCNTNDQQMNNPVINFNENSITNNDMSNTIMNAQFNVPVNKNTLDGNNTPDNNLKNPLNEKSNNFNRNKRISISRISHGSLFGTVKLDLNNKTGANISMSNIIKNQDFQQYNFRSYNPTSPDINFNSEVVEKEKNMEMLNQRSHPSWNIELIKDPIQVEQNNAIIQNENLQKTHQVPERVQTKVSKRTGHDENDYTKNRIIDELECDEASDNENCQINSIYPENLTKDYENTKSIDNEYNFLCDTDENSDFYERLDSISDDSDSISKKIENNNNFAKDFQYEDNQSTASEDEVHSVVDSITKEKVRYKLIHGFAYQILDSILTDEESDETIE